MTPRTKKALLWLAGAIALVWLFFKGRAAYALASAPWRTSSAIDGFPSNTHWTPHFSYNELGTALTDADFDAYLRTARLLEHVREKRGGLPLEAHIDGIDRSLTQAAIVLTLQPLPGQSLQVFAQDVADILTDTAQTQGLDWNWTPMVTGNTVQTLVPLKMLGL